MFLRILMCVVFIAFVIQTCKAWYVVRELAANEICVNTTSVHMAGNTNCPRTTFPIVNSTTNFDGVDRLPMINAMVGQEMTPCLVASIRMNCIKMTEVCSLDEKYLVTKVTKEECSGFLRCLPSGQFPDHFVTQVCEHQPLAAEATSVPGPVFDIVPPQKQTESASQSLRQSFSIIAAILTSSFAYMHL